MNRAAMTTHTAVIALTRFAANSDQCSVEVIVNDDSLPDPRLSNQTAMPVTPLDVSVNDPGKLAKAARTAEEFLPAMGWHLEGKWEPIGTGGVLCAPVVRGPRVNDSEMREAIVKTIAQYILRGDAHTKNPPHSDAQILDRARYRLNAAAADGYTFPGDSPQAIAADAAGLARRIQDTNPHWDDWAFGH